MTTERLRLHVKMLIPPLLLPDTMVASMRQVYSVAQIEVDLISTEVLDLPSLQDLWVGNCDSTITPNQQALFSNRRYALPNDVVAYTVRTILPPSEGCAAHPDTQPGAVIAQTATQWSLAHEIGHVLGLGHVDDDDYLMTGNGTENITNPPPKLNESEIATMRQSPLVAHSTPQIAAVRDLLKAHLPYEERLARLPAGGEAALSILAESGDMAIASQAVYLASLRKGPAAAEVVQKGLRHPAVHVRVAAAAAVKNLPARDRAGLVRLLGEERDAGVLRLLEEVVPRGTARPPKQRKKASKPVR